jgi:GNAT superfamily N-acetyltransferase
VFRPAALADAAAIAQVHVQSWAQTYSGLMPADFLTHMTSDATRERRAAHWAQVIEPASEVVIVAVQAEQVVGFASAGVTRPHAALPGDYAAELFTLYTLKAVQGSGLGRRLVQHTAAALLRGSSGLHSGLYRGLAVWVLDVNPARAFYRHLGGVELGQKTEDIPGGVLTEVALGWRDLKVLVGEEAGT